MIGIDRPVWTIHKPVGVPDRNSILVYGLRDRRKQFRFEFLYFAVMSLLGVIVLALGFALPYVGDDLFYRVYNIAVGLGIAIISTSKGVISDRQARKQRIGGELLALADYVSQRAT